jgi:outer membrane protein
VSIFNFRIGAFSLGLGLLVLGAAEDALAQGGPGRIGFVATERLYAESKLAKAADARIVAEFSSRDKSNREMFERLKKLSDKFDADAPGLAEPERTRRAREVQDLDKEMQRKDLVYRDDLTERKNYERARIAERAYALIGQIAEQEKIEVVFRDALWSRPGIDITDKILKQLDR